MESIPGILKSLKIRALLSKTEEKEPNLNLKDNYLPFFEMFIQCFYVHTVPSCRSALPDAWGFASLWTEPPLLHRTSPPDAQPAHCTLRPNCDNAK